MVFVFAFISLVLAASGLALAAFAARAFHTSSRIGIPVARAGKLREGRRKVRGQIAPVRQTLVSPATNRRCVYYRLQIDQERKVWQGNDIKQFAKLMFVYMFFSVWVWMAYLRFSRAAHSGEKVAYQWDKLLEDSKSVSLRLDDGTGSVPLDLDDARVVTKERKVFYSDLSVPFSARLQDLLRDRYDVHTVDDRGRIMVLRVTEDVLLEGAKVTAIGPVETYEDGTLGFESGDGDDRLLVSEADVQKEVKNLRTRGTLFAGLGGGSLLVALIFTVLTVVLLVGDW